MTFPFLSILRKASMARLSKVDVKQASTMKIVLRISIIY